jgi:glutaredoxin 2
LVKYKGLTSGGTSTIFRVTFVVSNAIAGEPVDLTSDFLADDSGTDPTIVAGAESVTVISYTDKNQYLNDVPWTVSFLRNNDSDSLLEDNEKTEITVWLLNRARYGNRHERLHRISDHRGWYDYECHNADDQ